MEKLELQKPPEVKKVPLKIPLYDVIERLIKKEPENIKLNTNRYEDYDIMELEERGLIIYY